MIPDQALVSDQSQKFVWVVSADGRAEYRKVTPGPLNDGLRVIREGLKPDDRVVALGLQSVRPGIKVEAKEEPASKFVTGGEQTK